MQWSGVHFSLINIIIKWHWIKRHYLRMLYFPSSSISYSLSCLYSLHKRWMSASPASSHTRSCWHRGKQDWWGPRLHETYVIEQWQCWHLRWVSMCPVHVGYLAASLTSTNSVACHPAPVVTEKKKCLQAKTSRRISLDIAKCPPEAKSSWVENDYFRMKL